MYYICVCVCVRETGCSRKARRVASGTRETARRKTFPGVALLSVTFIHCGISLTLPDQKSRLDSIHTYTHITGILMHRDIHRETYVMDNIIYLSVYILNLLRHNYPCHLPLSLQIICRQEEALENVSISIQIGNEGTRCP